MGVHRTGTVIARVEKEKYTDGSYREPFEWEMHVFVRWDDGVQGWTFARFLTKEI